MNAYGYIRVSTEEQAVDGVSLDAQQAKIAAWCLLNGYTLAGVFVDAGLSGKRANNRPSLQQALSAATKGNALVIYSLSRLSRNTKDTLAMAERLEKSGVDLVSLSEKIDTTTAAGKMVFRMLAVLAEFEQDQISERTTAAMAQKKAQGERVGSIPYGKRLAPDGKSLEDNPNELEVVRIVKTLRQGGMSFPKIDSELERRGFAPRGAKPWHPQTIKNISISEAA